MRAWQVTKYGRPSEALELVDVPDPTPDPGEIVVRTSASVLNYNEVDGCHGRYLTINPPLPYTLGMECVGEVIGAGAGRRVVDRQAGHRQRAWRHRRPRRAVGGPDGDGVRGARAARRRARRRRSSTRSTSPTSGCSSGAVCRPARRCSCTPPPAASVRRRCSSPSPPAPG